MNGTDVQSGHESHLTVYQAAEMEARGVVTRVNGGDFIAKDDVTDKTTLIHQQYMISGGGPSTYLHVVIGTDGQVDHGYLEYVEAGGRAIVGFSHTEAERIYQALRGSAAPWR